MFIHNWKWFETLLKLHKHLQFKLNMQHFIAIVLNISVCCSRMSQLSMLRELGVGLYLKDQNMA